MNPIGAMDRARGYTGYAPATINHGRRPTSHGVLTRRSPRLRTHRLPIENDPRPS
jgi:hypothetical protein